MAGLDPANHAAPLRIHLEVSGLRHGVDHRVEPGDDEEAERRLS
jgi:hypothetical protein